MTRKHALIALAVVLGLTGSGWILTYGPAAEPTLTAAPPGGSVGEKRSAPHTWTLSRSAVAELAQRATGVTHSPFLTRAEEAELFGAGAAGLPRLSGTLVSHERRVAWLDDHPRLQGESYAGFRVERIEPDRVLLRDRDRVYEIQLHAAPPSPVAEAHE